jgi:hypothetical protein
LYVKALRTRREKAERKITNKGKKNEKEPQGEEKR